MGGVWALFSGSGVPDDDGPAVAFLKNGRGRSHCNLNGNFSLLHQFYEGRPFAKRYSVSEAVDSLHDHRVDLCRMKNRCFGCKIGKSMLEAQAPYHHGVTDHITDQRWRTSGTLTTPNTQ